MDMQTEHPSKWELDWIDDPKNHHHYEAYYHRHRVKEAIVLRTSLRCLNGKGATIVKDELTPNYLHVPHRMICLEYLGKKYISRVSAYFANAFMLKAFFGNVNLLSRDNAVAIPDDHPILHLSDLMHKELGGQIIARSMDGTAPNSQQVQMACSLNGILLCYTISAVSSF